MGKRMRGIIHLSRRLSRNVSELRDLAQQALQRRTAARRKLREHPQTLAAT